MQVKITSTPRGIRYVHIVHAYRDERGRPRQRVVENCGRLADLLAGDRDALRKIKARATAMTAAQESGRGKLEYDSTGPSDGSSQLSVGSWLVEAALGRLGVTEVCRRAGRMPGRSPDLAKILADLIVSRIVRTESTPQPAKLAPAGSELEPGGAGWAIPRIAGLAAALRRTVARRLGLPRAQLGTVDYGLTVPNLLVDRPEAGDVVSSGDAPSPPQSGPPGAQLAITQPGLFCDRTGLPVGYRLSDSNLSGLSALEVPLAEFKQEFCCERVVVVGAEDHGIAGRLGGLHDRGDGWIVAVPVRAADRQTKAWLCDGRGWHWNPERTAQTKSRVVSSAIEAAPDGAEGAAVTVAERHVAVRAALAVAGQGVVGPGEFWEGYQLVRTSERGLSGPELLDRYRRFRGWEQVFCARGAEPAGESIGVRNREHVEAHCAAGFLALLTVRLIERWADVSAAQVAEAVGRFVAVPVGQGVYRLQRPAVWDRIDLATGVPLDQSWATISQLRQWRRRLIAATRRIGSTTFTRP